ncbi:MAG: efflux RND transporter periplasmic adaptor subunit [Burkholderiaceae bacterium]|nr:efflux RND transporter periplasmic adaptor subunit [Burkholderiaceae bacterium]
MTATRATQQAWQQTIAVQGPIAAWQEAVIGARVTNLPLVDVLVNVGDRVKKSQLLARFDERTVRAELAQAEAALAQAKSAARQAIANRDRVRALKDSGAVSTQDLETAETAADTAEAQQQLAQAQVVNQRLRLENCEVRAVDDGEISARSATVGMVAGAQGGTELFRMIRQGRLEWRAEVNGAQLSQVRVGQEAQIRLPDGSTAAGQVRQLAPAMDSASRMGTVYVDIRPGSAARASMYATGSIVLGTKQAWIVPAEAVVVRDGRSAVFKIGADGKVRKQMVEVGRRDKQMVEILEHLKDGDTVAVRGAGFLEEGDVVKVAAAGQEGRAP